MKDFVIYISCPPLFATGGTELLHQLGCKLNLLGFNAKMCYSGEPLENPVADRFLKYGVPFTYDVQDCESNFFIVPEVSTYILREFESINKVIWWLSIDNYFTVPRRRKITNFFREMIGIRRDFSFHDSYWDNVDHLVQSYYAKSFLQKRGVNSVFLSDYLGSEFMTLEHEVCLENRRDIVLYNPKKGFDFTCKIMEYAPDIEWVALEGMTPIEVSALLKKSKVYIDFGNHPGKDRFPREAAISGCCVITGMRGSAKFHEDVPILDAYKFNDSVDCIPDIVSRIRCCLDNFDVSQRDFLVYRDMIRGEEMSFENDVLVIFGKNNIEQQFA